MKKLGNLKRLKFESIDVSDVIKRKIDPNLAAKVSKMVAPLVGQTYDLAGERQSEYGSLFNFKPILDKRAQRNIANMLTLEILPDQQLALSILVSGILSPKDLTEVDPIFQTSKGVFTSMLASKLSNIAKEETNKRINFKEFAPDVLTKCLGTHGSRPTAVIPENAIDDFINSDRLYSTEAYSTISKELKTHRGLLANPYKEENNEVLDKPGYSYVVENMANRSNVSHYDPRMTMAFGYDARYSYENKEVNYLDYISVIDNISALKVPKLIKHRTSQIVNMKMESFVTAKYDANTGVKKKELSQSEIDNLLYQKNMPKTEHIAKLKKQVELKRSSIGDAMVVEFPSESVIRAFLRTNIKEAIGYYVAIDENGAPLYYPQENVMNPNINSGNMGSIAGGIIQRISTNLTSNMDKVDPTVKSHLDFIHKAAADLMEQDLTNRLKNGVVSADVALAKNDSFYMMMMSRQLEKKFTQVLFIPDEYMVYFAFDYTPDGLGKSILDGNSTINVYRAMLLHSDVIGSIKNSIGRSKINVKYDETDPDPMKTASKMVHEYVMSRQLRLPNTMSSPADQLDFVQRAGVEVEMTNHPGLPDTQVSIDQVQTSYNKPDSDIVEQLKKQSIMNFTIPPDLIDSVNQAELATTVVSQNLIVAKNVLRKQEIFNPLLTKFVRLNLKYSESIKELLLKEIQANITQVNITKEDIEAIYGIEIEESQIDSIKASVALQLFISSLDVKVPAPVTVNMEQQSEEYNKATEAYKTAIEAYMSSDFFNSDTAGDISGNADAYKAMLLAKLQRDWMAEKGYMTELAAMAADNDDGEDQLDLLRDTIVHIKQMTKNAVIVINELKPMIAAANKDLENASIDSEGAEGGGDTSSDSGGDESTSDESGGDEAGGDDAARGDDMGMDMDLGGDDAGGDGGAEFDDGATPE